jgi:hypothetical protein
MDPEVMTTVQQLSQYLCRHPDACDAPEGIARWWVAEPVPASVAESALSWMAARGVLEALHAADGRLRYRRVADDPLADGRLAALAQDPYAVLAPNPPSGLH